MARIRLRFTPPSMRAALISIVLAAVVTACGYKGPLYLPKPKPEAQRPAPAATPEEKKNDPSRQ